MMEKRELVTDYKISPVIKGGWQLSAGHSLSEEINNNQAVADIVSFVESGITTLDFGDIYTGVEELVGRALQVLKGTHGDNARELIQLHTKYVPNSTELDNFDKSDVVKIVNRSLNRLGVSQVDLVQFHWWRYEAKNYLAALAELFELKAVGKIRHVGITNFDLTRLKEMSIAGLKPASIQLQYSLIDRRPALEMAEYCMEHGIGILCYGTVAGGYFSEKYLNKPDPNNVETRSNIKYRLIIEEFGGWELFQELLNTLAKIALAHESDIGTIASAWVLSQPGVKAVIVGARNLSHMAANLKIPIIIFTSQEIAEINTVISKAKGPAGPVYDLERNSEKHRSIMHTSNN